MSELFSRIFGLTRSKEPDLQDIPFFILYLRRDKCKDNYNYQIIKSIKGARKV